MRLAKNKKAQSMLEYTILLSVVVAAILIMNVFVKRGFMGGLKDSADKMGDTFSAGNTSVDETRKLTTDQKIEENSGTGELMGKFTTKPYTGVIGHKAYSLSKRTGGDSTSEVKQQTDSATEERHRWGDYDAVKKIYPDIADPF